MNQTNMIPFSSEKTDACSTSEGADTEQQKAYEAQELEEICRRLKFVQKESFLPRNLDEGCFL
jgi:hypothetical protein